MIEFVKEEQVPFEQGMLLNIEQLLSVPFIAAGIFLIYVSAKVPPSRVRTAIHRKLPRLE